MRPDAPAPTAESGAGALLLYQLIGDLNMTAKHYPGVVEERHDFPAGRGKKGVFAIFAASGKKKRPRRFSRLDYLNAISLGRNPLLSYTYNLATDRASLDYYNGKSKQKYYEVLGRHDEEELLAFQLVTLLRQRQRDRQKIAKEHPVICHAGLNLNSLGIPKVLWLPRRLRERMERIVKKFAIAEGRRAARHRKLVNYKNRRSNFVG